MPENTDRKLLLVSKFDSWADGWTAEGRARHPRKAPRERSIPIPREVRDERPSKSIRSFLN